MKGLFLKRSGGKTTAMIYTSATTGYPIVVATAQSKQYIKEMAARRGLTIPEPITLSEDMQGKKLPGGILIDNAEEVIRAWATEHFNTPVVAFTMTLDGGDGT